MKNKFEEVFKKYDTDKTSVYSYGYNDAFDSLRNDIKLLFEIGVNRGGSVRAWKEYFPNAKIVGMEIDSSKFFVEDRISIEIGNASKKEFIDHILNTYGEPDIIIDDGSHFSSDIKKSYELLYDKAKICYAIEDYNTQCSCNHNGIYINDGVSAINIVHNKVEDLLCRKSSIKAIKVYDSLCCIFK